MKKMTRIVCLLSSLVAAAGLVGCMTSKPEVRVDSDMSRLTKSAAQLFERGQVESAARQYSRALGLARAEDNSLEIAISAYDLGACLIALERYETAQVFLGEARGEFERAGKPVADVMILQAKAARLLGQTDAAASIAAEILPSLKSGANDSYRMQVLLLEAHIACDRKDTIAAKASLTNLQQLEKKISDPVVKADVAGVMARIQQLDNDPAKAAEESDKQAELYKQAKKYRDMAFSLGRAGQFYLDAGILLPAGDRFYRSARSLYAQGDDVAALKMLEQSLNAAQKAQDQDAYLRDTRLFEEIKRAVQSNVGTNAVTEAKKP